MKDVFAKAAGYYGYRTPYPAAFFDLMADRCAISANSRIIDLCTGRGEVALGLADRAGSVLAVDSSSEMLRLATPHERINYLAADVNAPEFIQGLAGHRATHITVGRAMHWIEERVLSDLAAHALAENGKLVTVQSGFTRNNPWRAAYDDIRARVCVDTEPSNSLDFGKISSAGYDRTDKFSVRFNMQVDYEYLFKNMLSRSNIHEVVLLNRDLILSLMRQTMSAHLVGEQLSAEFQCKGFVYAYRKRAA